MEILIFFISFLAALLFSLGGVGAAITLIPILVSLGIPINTAKPVGLFAPPAPVRAGPMSICYPKAIIQSGFPPAMKTLQSC